MISSGTAYPLPSVLFTDRMNRFLSRLNGYGCFILGFAFTGGIFAISASKVLQLRRAVVDESVSWRLFARSNLEWAVFVKRFWCIICPMGYLMGLFKDLTCLN